MWASAWRGRYDKQNISDYLYFILATPWGRDKGVNIVWRFYGFYLAPSSLAGHVFAKRVASVRGGASVASRYQCYLRDAIIKPIATAFWIGISCSYPESVTTPMVVLHICLRRGCNCSTILFSARWHLNVAHILILMFVEMFWNLWLGALIKINY